MKYLIIILLLAACKSKDTYKSLENINDSTIAFDRTDGGKDTLWGSGVKKPKKDTVIVHDTIYTSKHYDHVEEVNIGVD
jgi:hypothetical protein